MWEMTFINQYGVTFSVRENELTNMSAMDYIQYALDAGSILVDMERLV